ncbi:MAG: V-type ATP synthase subunit D [Candidatus Omnitrophica bacterium]|nr:V-type ATP synthase subunit D [Candidatus Omnitrophota bacterium]MBL7151053.1 V-type ATP synthase subunit D [Candidatus Omnitrophota bacterium]
MKVKFTKGELKRQRDALRQYERYLPTLQLKKQQLQAEILRQLIALEEKRRDEVKRRHSIENWAGLFSDPGIDISRWIRPKEIVCNRRNIAGVDLPVFGQVKFDLAEYDLFSAPLWVDNAIEAVRSLACLREEIKVLEKAMAVLRRELRITTQRVNLFEKVKIPEAEEAIRLIKIYIGDQMANAVGRSKIAKRKIEGVVLEEVAA